MLLPSTHPAFHPCWITLHCSDSLHFAPSLCTCPVCIESPLCLLNSYVLIKHQFKNRLSEKSSITTARKAPLSSLSFVIPYSPTPVTCTVVFTLMCNYLYVPVSLKRRATANLEGQGSNFITLTIPPFCFCYLSFLNINVFLFT